MIQSKVAVFQRKKLREREQKVEALHRRFRAASRGARARAWLAQIGRRALVVYWIACLGVIGAGLMALHPEIGHRLAYALRDPAMDLAAPFPNCAAARAAGYSDIPVGSLAYVERQDGDLDGLACEPYPHSSWAERTSRIWRRWQSGGPGRHA